LKRNEAKINIPDLSRGARAFDSMVIHEIGDSVAFRSLSPMKTKMLSSK
jgi:hypothetical protein